MTFRVCCRMPSGHESKGASLREELRPEFERHCEEQALRYPGSSWWLEDCREHTRYERTSGVKMTHPALAPLPWRVGTEEEARSFWTDAAVIMDAAGGVVAVLTRGYEGDENGGCPSWVNARMIVESVNKANGYPAQTVSLNEGK